MGGDQRSHAIEAQAGLILKTITVTAELRASGLTATALLDGPMTGTRFRSYVEETLVRSLERGDTVVLDNLPAHKVTGIRERIEAAGARLLYLPAYSPDLDPIERTFAKLKAILRAEDVNRHQPLEHHQTGLQRSTSDECRNCFAAAGYDAYEPT